MIQNPSSCASPDHAPRLLEPVGPVNRLRQGETNAVHRPARQQTRRIVAITLQSTIGGFSAEFMRRLPKLEQAMIPNGLDPTQLLISQIPRTPPTRARSWRSSSYIQVPYRDVP